MHALTSPTRPAAPPRLALMLALALLAVALPAAPRPASFAPPAVSPQIWFLPEGDPARPDRLLAQALGGQVALTAGGAELALPDGARVAVRFEGASSSPRLRGAERLPGVVNQLVGADSADWRLGSPIYAAAVYEGLYPGVDLRYDGARDGLKGTYTVAPGGDPDRIRWRYEGAAGLTITPAGDLRAALPGGGALLERAPVAWQDVGEERRPVPISFRLDRAGDGAALAGFTVGAYDRRLPLTIDPALVYASYLGGSSAEWAYDVAVDGQGNIYVAGETASRNFPTRNPIGELYGGGLGDAFVAKLAPDGRSLIYATFLGGGDVERATALAVDGQGSAYVFGWTQSDDFPVAGSLGPECHGSACNDSFVAKLGPTGQLVYGAFVGGAVSELGGDIAVDGQGSAYIIGGSSSKDLPTSANAFQRGANFAIAGSSTDAYVAKINPAGSAFSYFTYLGGGDFENNFFGSGAIAVDGQGRAYVTGYTRSADFPTRNPTQPIYGGDDDPGGGGDAFVAVLNAQGSDLIFSTFLGGRGDENTIEDAIALDGDGNIIVSGETDSPNFPVKNALQPAFASSATPTFTDAFVVKYAPLGASVLFSTYLGSANLDKGKALAIGADNSIYLVAASRLDEVNPLPSGAGRCEGVICGYLAKLRPDGSALEYGVRLASRFGNDELAGVALTPGGEVVVAGRTNSPTLPNANGVQTSPGGGYDALVLKVSERPALVPPPSNIGAPGSSFPIGVGNFGPSAPLRLFVNGLPIGTLNTGASGFGQFALRFPPTLRPGVYTLRVAGPQPAALAADVSLELQITLSASAPVRTAPAGLPVVSADSGVRVYLPSLSR